MEKPRIPKSVLQFFKETGAEGGKARAEKHSKEQLSEWGKKGGRPKKNGKTYAGAKKQPKGKVNVVAI